MVKYLRKYYKEKNWKKIFLCLFYLFISITFLFLDLYWNLWIFREFGSLKKLIKIENLERLNHAII